MRTRPIDIVYFSNSRQRGGAEEHIVTLLRGLDGERFRVSWVMPPALAAAMAGAVPAGVEVVPLELRHPADGRAALGFTRLLRQRRPDIVHAHLFRASLAAAPLARMCGVPVTIETPHIRESWRSGWKAHYAVDRFAARAVNRFIAVSEANARYLIEEKGLPPHKVHVIANGCDLSRFHPDRPEPEGWRARLGFASDDRVFTVLARLEPQKGHAVLLHALPAVVANFPGLRVALVGDGNLRVDLENLSRRLGLERVVRFAGFQSDIGGWLALSEATVLPSFYEGLPLAAIESLAAARAVLASSVDGTPEVVRDGHTGLLFPAGDSAALTRALCRALADPAECRRWGRQGRQWVERRFDQRRQVEQTAELYCAAIGDGWKEKEKVLWPAHNGSR